MLCHFLSKQPLRYYAYTIRSPLFWVTSHYRIFIRQSFIELFSHKVYFNYVVLCVTMDLFNNNFFKRLPFWCFKVVKWSATVMSSIPNWYNKLFSTLCYGNKSNRALNSATLNILLIRLSPEFFLLVWRVIMRSKKNKRNAVS